MPFKLIKLSPAGEILTGDDLKQILQNENFHLPEMPPKIIITVPAPKQADYDPANYMTAYKQWFETYKRPAIAREELRDSICRQFARDLERDFAIIKRRRTRLELCDPGINGTPKHMVFALRLTNLNQEWGITDPIEWIAHTYIL